MIVTLKKQLQAYNNNGIFLSYSRHDIMLKNVKKRFTTANYLFSDWYCRDSSLKYKANKLFGQLQKFIAVFSIDTESTYVTFQNKAPIKGPKYDCFKIYDLKTDELLWEVIPRRTFSKNDHRALIWGSNYFEVPVVEAETYTQALAELHSLNTQTI